MDSGLPCCKSGTWAQVAPKISVCITILEGFKALIIFVNTLHFYKGVSCFQGSRTVASL